MITYYLQNLLMESVQTVWYSPQIYAVRRQYRLSAYNDNKHRGRLPESPVEPIIAGRLVAKKIKYKINKNNKQTNMCNSA